MFHTQAHDTLISTLSNGGMLRCRIQNAARPIIAIAQVPLSPPDILLLSLLEHLKLHDLDVYANYLND